LTAKATDVDGNAGVSTALPVTIANGAAAATLTQIQAHVFSPNCSGCHNGSNPPSGAQNLTAGNAFANLVNVPSKDLPGLFRAFLLSAPTAVVLSVLPNYRSIFPLKLKAKLNSLPMIQLLRRRTNEQ
jgi:hypothetical protein